MIWTGFAALAFAALMAAVVAALKRAEHEDCYDCDTDFNPFTLKV